MVVIKINEHPKSSIMFNKDTEISNKIFPKLDEIEKTLVSRTKRLFRVVFVQFGLFSASPPPPPTTKIFFGKLVKIL